MLAPPLDSHHLPVQLRPARDARFAGAVSFAIPEVIVFPPQEEDMNEPCISYAPNESLQGLPNPHATHPRSLINALLQLFTCLPNLNEELPVASKLPIVSDFVRMVRSLQCDGKDEAARIADADLVALDWWRDACDFPADTDPASRTHIVQNVERVARALFDLVLAQTRFGRRFEMGLIDGPHPSSLRHIAASVTFAGKGRTDSAVDVDDMSPPSLTEKRTLTDSILSIPLAQYADNETVSLIPLLNDHFGHAVAGFFFGGPFNNRSILQSSPSLFRTPTASPLSTPNGMPDRQTKFTRLPHYLTLHLNRPIVAGKCIYHNPTVELPLEVDLGYYLENRQSDQKTFYRLHGFTTQSEGHFITYTRLRGGSIWLKCDDERVQEVELGMRVESRGVMLVIYRLQER